MTCPTPPISAGSTGLTLNPALLPNQALYGAAENGQPGWVLAAQPFTLSRTQHQTLNRLGGVLVQFISGVETLYRDSLAGRAPDWVSAWLDAGKPEALRQFAAMKRLKPVMPMLLRPDLLITESGFALTEIDSVPGGLGFTAMLNHTYRESGFAVLEGPHPLPRLWLDSLLNWYAAQKQSRTGQPFIAVVISDEAGDYRPEWRWFTQAVQAEYPGIAVVHPRELQLQGEALVWRTPEGTTQTIDLIYRFFELFDLPNIPNAELIQFAVKKGWVALTPPYKPVHEEKLNLALLHHPMLAAFWQGRLGEDFDWLKRLVPPTWVMDPTPLSGAGVIPGLNPEGNAIQSFEALKTLGQKGRRLVIKPSGFSPLAWGSRGVAIGHDMAQGDWADAIDTALKAFPSTPYVLQPFENTAVQTIRSLNPDTGRQQELRVRTRLCPYYLVSADAVKLGGILATACPADKKIIHGMQDAILAPAMLDSDLTDH
ncbi:MAG: hypothetical protein AB7P76_00120 [Candidatus Melainabacteria bacterium]